MKVVFSERIKHVLSDPKAAEQLVEFMEAVHLGKPHNIEITVKDSIGKTVRYVPRIVPIF
jgi:hypothetical protein